MQCPVSHLHHGICFWICCVSMASTGLRGVNFDFFNHGARHACHRQLLDCMWLAHPACCAPPCVRSGALESKLLDMPADEREVYCKEASTVPHCCLWLPEVASAVMLQTLSCMPRWLFGCGLQVCLAFCCLAAAGHAHASPSPAALQNDVQSALPKIVTAGFKAVRLIYYFTAGVQEVTCGSSNDQPPLHMKFVWLWRFGFRSDSLLSSTSMGVNESESHPIQLAALLALAPVLGAAGPVLADPRTHQGAAGCWRHPLRL